MRRIFLCLVFVLLVVSSAVAEHALTPKLDIVDVIERAVEYAKTQNIEIQDYYVASAEWGLEAKWEIQLISRHRPEGDYFCIYINDDLPDKIRIFFGE